MSKRPKYRVRLSYKVNGDDQYGTTTWLDFSELLDSSEFESFLRELHESDDPDAKLEITKD